MRMEKPKPDHRGTRQGGGSGAAAPLGGNAGDGPLSVDELNIGGTALSNADTGYAGESPGTDTGSGQPVPNPDEDVFGSAPSSQGTIRAALV